jgi:glycine cleavage system H protein
MARTPDDRKYSKDHEWVQLSDGEDTNRARVGITEFAANQLGDIVFVDAQADRGAVTMGDEFGSLESVKAVSEVYAPVTGTVVAVNEALADEPELVNSDPYGDGWLIEIEIEAPDQLTELMTADAYEEFVASTG